jgi:uncharacterized protein YerC
MYINKATDSNKVIYSNKVTLTKLYTVAKLQTLTKLYTVTKLQTATKRNVTQEAGHAITSVSVVASPLTSKLDDEDWSTARSCPIYS